MWYDILFIFEAVLLSFCLNDTHRHKVFLVLTVERMRICANICWSSISTRVTSVKSRSSILDILLTQFQILTIIRASTIMWVPMFLFIYFPQYVHIHIHPHHDMDAKEDLKDKMILKNNKMIKTQYIQIMNIKEIGNVKRRRRNRKQDSYLPNSYCCNLLQEHPH